MSERRHTDPLPLGGEGNLPFSKGLLGRALIAAGAPRLRAYELALRVDGDLRERGVESIAVCGITTNHCCETTARMGGNLGYDVRFVLDATHTFDLRGPDGAVFPADTVAQMTAANLHGEFATVVQTAALL